MINNHHDRDDDRPSRSQRKRDSTALQRLAERLLALPLTRLPGLPLTDDLRAAAREWHNIPTFEGRRRQAQYLGRLMREEGDAEALQQALDALSAAHDSGSAAFKRLEALRDELMAASEGELTSLLAPFGQEADGLRDLVRKARNERLHQRPPRDFRALFRKLKALSEAAEA